jgi:predicted PurR-regulated permease PerM
MWARRRIIVLTIFFLVIALLLWGIIIQLPKIAEISKYIFFSAVVAYILTPLNRWLELYMSPAKAVILLYLLLVFVSVLLMVLFIPILIKQAVALIHKLPLIIMEIQTYIMKLQNYINRLGVPYSIQLTINEYRLNCERWLLSFIKGKMKDPVEGVTKITAIFTIPVLSFYFIKDREYFKRLGLSLIPSKVRNPIYKMAVEISKILNQFIRGQLLVAAIVGILATIGYMIIGLPYAAVMGLLAGIFEIIPYLGPVLGAIPAGMIAVLHSPSKLLASIMVMIIVQQLESNIFTPKIMGDHVGMHPVYIILALWIAGASFGIVGMFFAVPAVLILKVLIKNLYLGIVSGNY